MFSISQVLVGSAPLKPYGFDKGCKHTYIMIVQMILYVYSPSVVDDGVVCIVEEGRATVVLSREEDL